VNWFCARYGSSPEYVPTQYRLKRRNLLAANEVDRAAMQQSCDVAGLRDVRSVGTAGAPTVVPERQQWVDSERSPHLLTSVGNVFYTGLLILSN